MKKTFLNLIVISVIISSCAVVNPGEVGVKQQFGKLKGEVQNQGLVILNPLITELVKVPTRTVNKEVGLQPSFKRRFKCSGRNLYFISCQAK